MSKTKKNRISHKMGGRNAHTDIVSYQLHNLSLSDSENLPEIETLVKTYNSASRCAFKRFKDMGLNGMLKGNHGRRNFWQVDKEVGSPIQGTSMKLKEWLVKNGYVLDSTLLQNAVMTGFKTYKSFERKQSKWQTSKENPSFGDMDARSRNKLTKDEFQLTRNASITVIGGKAKGGNQKFKLDSENCTLSFVWRRKRIEFSFRSSRFSRKGLKTLELIARGMEDDSLPVTVTLTRIGSGRFNATLTFSAGELNKLKKKEESSKSPRQSSSIVAGIWVNDEVVHHQVMDVARNKVIHSRTWKVEDFSGEKRTRKYLDERIARKDWNTVNAIKRKIANRTISETSRILNKIFSTSKGYGAKTVVVESARSKGIRQFNNSFISFSKDKIRNGSSRTCFMTYSRLVKQIKSQCSKFGMELGKVDGAFIQMKAILESPSMTDAIRNACTCMVGRFVRNEKPDTDLTCWRKWMSDPSMLDWVGHLLHNKRSRQARSEIRKAFKSRTVEKAVRLVDNRNRLGSVVSR